MVMKQSQENNNSHNTNTMALQNSKSTEHTVFVRFVPTSSILRRLHIEDYFSQIGPIKKASLIHKKNDEDNQGSGGSSYGFIKYTCETDAEEAAKKLNRSTLELPQGDQQDGQPHNFQVMVELASSVQNKQQQPSSESIITEHQKKHNRVILRNLSFYATTEIVQDTLTKKFGDLIDVHIPTVKGKSRGFCFCTFRTTVDAQKAIDAKEIDIRNRKATIQWSVCKRVHDKQQQDDLKLKRKRDYQDKVRAEQGTNNESSREQEKKEDDKKKEDDDSDDASSSSDDDDGDSSSSGSSSESEGGDSDKESDGSDSEVDDEDSEDEEDDKPTENLQQPVQEQRQLFVRNLPFDATRHDVFETFRTYGTIEAIYLVTNPVTKLPRGTAFVTYKKPAGAARALRKNSAIILKGRPLVLDYAVDKETATTLVRDSNHSETKKLTGKDKRNFYLRGEGRVDDEQEWANISEAEKNKRQRAWHDKITKLKSPLFFVNAHRLSIRNIAKGVDEADIKKLLFQATQRGLQRKLVSIDDLVAEWSASGEYSAREILEKRKQYQRKDKHQHSGIEPLPDKDNSLKPESLDERNIKRTISSVYLDRDFEAAGGTKNVKMAPSRGFAFAEFTYHVQALACLRELNNNTMYTEEYAAGGKAASAAVAARKRGGKKKMKDGDEEGAKLPRIIVEFTVENRAKAKQQAEHRAQQQANRQRQKLETKEKREGNGSSEGEKTKSQSKKRGRGAKQREKKRQRELQGDNDKKDEKAKKEPKADKADRKRKNAEMEQQDQKPKGVKPPKKQKKGKRKEVEAEDKLSKLVQNYNTAVNDTSPKEKKAGTPNPSKKEAMAEGKRWFE
ncbi:RNA-binding protein 28 [Seminavis robusta]|uniref:RNA-binding protein 28 n=1 Tax=Seminavis robusta TaxID=568900 RepID=A0A9N8DNY2_9STRA|nr:RNA-binding protein 28 [Seminavis robusta]|eukprot:Sro251_g099260.1 RNA-binding protein 28 (844) ;mRNA; f:33455-35986